MNIHPLIFGTIASLALWAALFVVITADSKQKCETMASADVCAWELR